MGKPKNVDELIAYLHSHPRVSYTNVIRGTFNQSRTFNRSNESGIKWVVKDAILGDVFAYTPIYCSIAEGKLAFDEDSFSFTAFGITGRFYYED